MYMFVCVSKESVPFLQLYNKEFSTVVIEAVHDLNVIFGGSLQKGQPVRSFDALDATMKYVFSGGDGKG